MFLMVEKAPYGFLTIVTFPPCLVGVKKRIKGKFNELRGIFLWKVMPRNCIYVKVQVYAAVAIEQVPLYSQSIQLLSTRVSLRYTMFSSSRQIIPFVVT